MKLKLKLDGSAVARIKRCCRTIDVSPAAQGTGGGARERLVILAYWWVVFVSCFFYVVCRQAFLCFLISFAVL